LNFIYLTFLEGYRYGATRYEEKISDVFKKGMKIIGKRSKQKNKGTSKINYFQFIKIFL